jgi:GntR family transcriptional repressor for pyruvate dehydrogenase complex
MMVIGSPPGEGSGAVEVNNLREPKLAERVAAVLRRLMIHGEIPEGAMLPSESDLMERFGVSRPTLREAFRVLESESLISVERGVHGGARVSRPRREMLSRYAGLILKYEGVTLQDVYDAWARIETPVVVQLARNRDPLVVAELDRVNEKHSRIEPGVDAVARLGDFHSAIARLSPNKTLQMVNTMLHHLIAQANSSPHPATRADVDDAARRSAKIHRVLVDLIRSGEAERAGELWRRHLTEAGEAFFTRADLSAVVDVLE